MANKQVVLAIFKDEAAADAAVESLKAWDKTSDDVKLNAIGILVLDESGKVKAHKVGQRSVGKGAGIGIILSLLTPVGLVAGIVGGGILGALHHKGLGLKDEDRARIGAELSGGKAAVGVLVAPDESAAIAAKLAEFGGTPEVHDLTEEQLAEASAAAAEAPAEVPAEVPVEA